MASRTSPVICGLCRRSPPVIGGRPPGNLRTATRALLMARPPQLCVARVGDRRPAEIKGTLAGELEPLMIPVRVRNHVRSC